MSIYFPQVVIPTPHPKTTLDVSFTVQGSPPTGALVALRDALWYLQAVFTADSRIQKFPINTLQGDHFLVGHKYTEPKAASARLVTLTGEDQSFYLDIDEGQRPRPGHGYLAGDHPEGITRVEGEPSPATIRVHYRAESGTPGDGVLVAEVQSNEDGTWLVQGLDPDLKFDVICRYPGYNDMILSNVSPVLAAGLQFEGSFATLDDQVEILLGTGPYQVDVVDGALPLGVEIQVAGDVMSLVGQPGNFGVFEFTLRVIDADGLSGVLPGTVEVAAFDPHWDDVVALLRFDGGFADETGRVWTAGTSTSIDSSAPIFGSSSLKISGFGEGLYTGNPIADPSASFTIEGFFRVDGLPPVNSAGLLRTALWLQNQSGSQGEFGIAIDHSGSAPELYLYLGGGAAGLSFTANLPDFNMGEVNHVAHCYDGTTHRIFVGGRAVISTTQPFGWKNTNQPFRIGQSINPTYMQYRHGGDATFDEFRITKGVARYTENFDPPTEPFPNVGP